MEEAGHVLLAFLDFPGEIANALTPRGELAEGVLERVDGIKKIVIIWKVKPVVRILEVCGELLSYVKEGMIHGLLEVVSLNVVDETSTSKKSVRSVERVDVRSIEDGLESGLKAGEIVGHDAGEGFLRGCYSFKVTRLQRGQRSET